MAKKKADTIFIFDPRVHMDLSDEDRANLDKLERFETIPWFIEVVKLTPGQTFGELALLNSESRKARIFCITECNFATLNKQSFKRVLKGVKVRKQESKLKFIQKLPYMIHQSRNQVKKIVNFFAETNYIRNQTVFNQGE